MQDEVAEKEREAKSKKRLQEVASTARDEATARATKATQDHERAFTRANPAAAALVRMMCIPPDDVWIQLSSRTDGWSGLSFVGLPIQSPILPRLTLESST